MKKETNLPQILDKYLVCVTRGDEKCKLVTYGGLLALAHPRGLRKINTEILQIPSKENQHCAVVRASVATNTQVFTELGLLCCIT